MVDIHQEGHSQRSAPKRRHMVYIRWHSRCTPRKLSSWDQGGDKMHHTPGRVRSPSTWSPELLGLGKGTKPDPTESVPLWSTQKHEPEQLKPGKYTQPRAHFRQFPCRATWNLSSVDWESTHAVNRGKPSVAQTHRTLPTHTSDNCLQFSSPCPQHSTTEQARLYK